MIEVALTACDNMCTSLHVLLDIIECNIEVGNQTLLGIGVFIQVIAHRTQLAPMEYLHYLFCLSIVAFQCLQ